MGDLLRDALATRQSIPTLTDALQASHASPVRAAAHYGSEAALATLLADLHAELHKAHNQLSRLAELYGLGSEGAARHHQRAGLLRRAADMGLRA
jgi:hypothetical protein